MFSNRSVSVQPSAPPIEYAGVLTVTDPARMVVKLWSGEQPGLGSARGFGCGLMLVRRARAAEESEDEDE